MRMFAALPIAATLAVAIGLSNLTPAKAKTLAGCKSDRAACARSCAAYPEGEFKRSCSNRCHAVLAQCAAGAQGRGGGKNVKTGGEQPAPKGPVLGGSTGTNGGGPPIVKRIKR